MKIKDRLEEIYTKAIENKDFDPAIKVAVLLEQIYQQEKTVIAPVGNVKI